MLIRTARLLLRPTFAEDAGELYQAINDAGIVTMLSRAPWPYLPEHAVEFCSVPFDPLSLRFAVTLPEERGCPMIGQVGIGPFATGSERELGYWIAREHWGRGYATEAAEAVLDAASVLGTAGVDSGHFLENTASGAVLRRCGFVETGEIRPTPCAGRGGELVLTRRYACDLSQRPFARMTAFATAA